MPLGALQVLAIDLGSDVLPGLALGTEHPEPGVMDLPPRPHNERLMSRTTLRRVAFIGVIQSIWAVTGFLYVLLSHGWDWGDKTWMNPGSPHYGIYREAITMTQAAIVMCQVANGFGCRTEQESVFKVGLSRTRFLVDRRDSSASSIIAAISYSAFLAEHLQDRPANTDRLGYHDRRGSISLFFAEEARKCSRGAGSAQNAGG